MPDPSLPKTKSAGTARLAEKYSAAFSSKAEANIWIPYSDAKSLSSHTVTSFITGIVKRDPIDERTTLSPNGSTEPLRNITPVHPAASALRITVPAFPGS